MATKLPGATVSSWPIPGFPKWRLLGSSVERPQSGSSIGEAFGRHRPVAVLRFAYLAIAKLPPNIAARRTGLGSGVPTGGLARGL